MNSPASSRLSPEGIFQLKLLQDAVLSPDASQAVMCISAADADGGNETSSLWRVDLESGAQERLTWGAWRDFNPTWAPDGNSIAFLSTRAGAPQIYRLALAGGEAQPLTSLEKGVSGGPVWSPDGKRIAFTAVTGQPVDTTQPYRVTRPVYRFNEVGLTQPASQDIFVLTLADGAVDQVTQDDFNNSAPVWSPDGGSLAFTAALDPASSLTMPRLKVARLGGEVLDPLNGWGYALAAAWLADGKSLAFVGQSYASANGTLWDLWTYDLAGGEPQCRTLGYEGEIAGAIDVDLAEVLRGLFAPELILTPDGKSVLVSAQRHGETNVVRVALYGEEQVDALLSGGRVCSLLGASPERLLYAVGTPFSPADLWVCAADGSQEKQLTHLNAELMAEWPAFELKDLAVTSRNGDQVQAWLLKPAGEGPFPTLLAIHGGPQEAFGYAYCYDFQMLASAGYAVLYANPHGSTGYGDAFCQAINQDWGSLDYDDLMRCVDAAIEKGWADAERLGVFGLSYGGYMTCWIIGHTGRFKAAVPQNPVTNLASMYGTSDISAWFMIRNTGGKPHEVPQVYQRLSPITYAHQCTTPALFLVGEADHRCPPEQSEQFYTVLKAEGCPVEMVRFPGGGHMMAVMGSPEMRKVQNEALLEWMDRYIPGRN